jgi:hypothetical protein
MRGPVVGFLGDREARTTRKDTRNDDDGCRPLKVDFGEKKRDGDIEGIERKKNTDWQFASSVVVG